jgi:uncharacterized repeat protein (TIGR02543 family)
MPITSLTPAAQAAEVNADNPVIFTVRGGITAGTDAVNYQIVVDGVYDQSYQSFNVIYPDELTIDTSAVTSGIWTISTSENGANTTTSFIMKSGSRTAAQLQQDIQAISFSLTNAGVFPPEGSKVTITASEDKVTAFIDAGGYVHYYVFVPGTTSTYWFTAYNAAHAQTMQDPRYPTDPTKVLHGYLATITSQAEQRKVYNDIATLCGWLAGTRALFGTAPTGYASLAGQRIQDQGSQQPGSANTADIPTTSIPAAGATTVNYDIAVATATTWYWADGPEAWTVYDADTATYTYYPMGMTTVPDDVWVIQDANGQNTYLGSFSDQPTVDNLPAGASVIPDPNRGQPVGNLVFYNKITNATAPAGKAGDPTGNGAPAGVYANWNNPYGVNVDGVAGTGAEPNNSSGEYVTQFAYTGKDLWNDFSYNPSSTVKGYYVEFGGYVGDPLASDLVGSEITTSSEVQMVMPIHVEYRSTATNADGTRRLMTGIGTDSDHFWPYQEHLPYVAYITKELDPTKPTYGTVYFTLPPGYSAYGYEFVGTQEDKDKLTVDADGNVAGFHSLYNQTIRYLFQPDTYTVTFNPNWDGANSSNVTPASKTVLYDTPYGDLATATRKGYTQTGWYACDSAPTDFSVDGCTEVTADSLVPLAGDSHALTLYAGWEVNDSYTVTYDVTTVSDDLGCGPATDIPDKTQVAWTDINLTPGSGLTAPSLADPSDSLTATQTLTSDTIPTRDNCVFTGWDVSENGTAQGVTSTDAYGDVAASDTEPGITLEAQWRRAQYLSVIYHLNGGTTQDPLPDISQPAEIGDFAVNLPTPSRDGYTFSGWRVADNGTHTVTSDDEAFLPGQTTYASIAAKDADGNVIATYVVIEAVWTATDYTVNYDGQAADDSTLSPTSFAAETVTWDEAGVVPPAEGNPERDGYFFMGWNTEKDGTGILAGSSSTYDALAQGDPTVTSVTLYAQWQPEPTYFVQYDLAGGSYTDPSSTDPSDAQNTLTTIAKKDGVHASDADLIPDVDLTREGYTFVGWSVAYNGSKVGVTSTDTFGSLAANLNAGYIVLQAQYQPKSDYTVKYNLQGGTLDGATTVPDLAGVVWWTQESILPRLTPVRSGYTFLGWNTAADGTGRAVTTSDSFASAAGQVEPADNTLTLYAQWAGEGVYTVQYNVGIGTSPIASAQYTATPDDIQNQTVDLPVPQAPAGYTFSYWTVSNNGYDQSSSAAVKDGTTYSALAYPVTDTSTPPQVVDWRHTITLTAQYAESADYIVAYDGQCADSPDISPTTGVAWTDSGFTPAVTCPGKNLVGWTLTPDGTGSYVLPTTQFRDLAQNTEPADGTVTLYAQWSDASFVVQYDLGGIAAPDGWQPQRTVGFNDTNLIPTETLDRLGYTLTGWKVSANGATAALVTDSDSFGTLAAPNAPFIRLEAQWGPKSYVVNYDLNDARGYTRAHPQSIDSTPAVGEDGALRWNSVIPFDTGQDTPWRNGFTFDGWTVSMVGDTAVDGDGAVVIPGVTKYSDVGSYTDAQGDAMDADSITIQAQWTENPPVPIAYSVMCLTNKANPVYQPLAHTPCATVQLNSTTKPDPNVNPDQATDIDQDVPDDDVSTVVGEVLPASGVAGGAMVARKPGHKFLGWYKADRVAQLLATETPGVFDPDQLPEILSDTDDLVSDQPTYVPSRVPVDDGEVYEQGAYVALFQELPDVTLTYQAVTLATEGTCNSLTCPDTVANGGFVKIASDDDAGITESESVAPATGTAVGSDALVKKGYKFWGWSTDTVPDTRADAARLSGTGPADDTTAVSTFLPARNPDGTYGTLVTASDQTDELDPVTYYAIFSEEDNVDLSYRAVTLSPSGTVECDGVDTDSCAVSGGTIDHESDSVPPASGTAEQNTATAASGFVFLGWFNRIDDGSYLDQTPVSTDTAWTPPRVSDLNVDGNYVAVFQRQASLPTVVVTQIDNVAVTTLGDVALRPDSGEDDVPLILSDNAFAGEAWPGTFTVVVDGKDTGVKVTLAAPSGDSDAQMVTTVVNYYTVTMYRDVAEDPLVAISAQIYLAGSSHTIADPQGPTADQFFEGWTDDPTATDPNPQYNHGDTIQNITAPVTLYGVWTTTVQYSVTYDVNGAQAGSVEDPNSTYDKDSLAPVLDAPVSAVTPPDGMTFAGWATSSDATTATLQPGTSFKVSADTVLYAVWAPLADGVTPFVVDPDAPMVEITYKANGGRNAPVDPSEYEQGESLIVLSGDGMVAPAGMHFAGWASSPDASKADPGLAPGTVLTVDQALTVYAVWVENDPVDVGYVIECRNGDGSDRPDPSTPCSALTLRSGGSDGGGDGSAGSGDSSSGSTSDDWKVSETVAPLTGKLSGVDLKDIPGYAFKGWWIYPQDNIEGLPPLSTDETWTPPRNADGTYAAVTYVAVFQEIPDATVTYTLECRNADDSDRPDHGTPCSDLTVNSSGKQDPWTVSESTAPATGKLSGVTLAEIPGYTFLGWWQYPQDDLRTEAPLSTDLNWTPGRGTDGTYTDITYVAVFRAAQAPTLTQTIDDSAAMSLGDRVTLTINADLPSLPADQSSDATVLPATLYRIEETLPAQLGLVDAPPVVTLASDGKGSGGSGSADSGSGDSGSPLDPEDYQATVDPETNTLVVTLTKQGLAQAAEWAASGQHLSVVFQATVVLTGDNTPDPKDIDGLIASSAQLFVNDPSTPAATSEADTHFGGVSVYKFGTDLTEKSAASAATAKAFNGTTFEVFSKADYDAHGSQATPLKIALPPSVRASVQATTGKPAPVAISEFVAGPAGINPDRNRPDKGNNLTGFNADGNAVICGLKNGEYYLVETKAPKGYTLDPEPIPFTLTQDLDHDSTWKDTATSVAGGVNAVIRYNAHHPDEMIVVDPVAKDKTPGYAVAPGGGKGAGATGGQGSGGAGGQGSGGQGSQGTKSHGKSSDSPKDTSSTAKSAHKNGASKSGSHSGSKAAKGAGSGQGSGHAASAAKVASIAQASWPLLNLLLAIVAALATLVTGRWAVRRRDDDDDDEAACADRPVDADALGVDRDSVALALEDQTEGSTPDESTAEDSTRDNATQSRRGRLRWLALSAFLAVAGIILFLVTEDLHGLMVWWDRWTIVHVVLTAGAVAVLVHVLRARRDSARRSAPAE